MIALNSPLKPNLKKLTKYLEIINNNGWYTNFGPLHDELTSRLEDYLGVNNLLLVNNGTTALQVAGRTLNCDSIISTPFSFVATISAFEWQKDSVYFADIDRNSYNLSPNEVSKAFQQGCKADAIVATHVYGNPCDVDEFKSLSQQQGCKLIYDAAHAFGVKIRNKSVLNYGDASTLSFHATKVFHTGEGGAIVFKSNDHYEKAKELINFGIKKGIGLKQTGINAKLSEYHSAVGLVNLDEIDNVLDYRANLFHTYREGLKDLVEIPYWHPEANVNGAYMPIKLKDKAQLDRIVKMLSKESIQSRNYFSPSLDSMFSENINYGTENSQIISESVLSLPMHGNLRPSCIKKILNQLKRAIND